MQRSVQLIRKGAAMKRKPKRRKKRNSAFAADERFATKALIVIAITTAVFVVMQYISFLITGMEQTTLITYFFTVVGIECGGMLLKRITEVAVARIKKKEKINNESEEFNNV